jgi:hypothetical protein
MERQGSLRARPRLGQHLRGQHAEREAGVDDAVGQALGGEPATLDDRVEADLLGMADALVEGLERFAVVEIGHGDVMPRGAQLAGERADAVGEALGVLEQDDVGHRRSPYAASAEGLWNAQ